jgi:hypothetical protein
MEDEKSVDVDFTTEQCEMIIEAMEGTIPRYKSDPSTIPNGYTLSQAIEQSQLLIEKFKNHLVEMNNH